MKDVGANGAEEVAVHSRKSTTGEGPLASLVVGDDRVRVLEVGDLMSRRRVSEFKQGTRLVGGNAP